jgi:hypothetical protein
MKVQSQTEVTVFDPKSYSAMQVGKPYRKYQKTILGKVFVTVLNPFSGQPEGIVIEGDPSLPEDQEKITVCTWNVKEDVFFRRMNVTHFTSGNLREIPIPELPEEDIRPKSVNEISDEEILDLLNKPFLALKNRLNKFTAPAPAFRILKKAEDMEKSEKILDAIRARLSELEFVLPAKLEAEKQES